MDGFKFIFLIIPSLLAVINNHDFNNRYYNICVFHLRHKDMSSFF